MRLWKFIFLKNWEEDRVPTGEALGQLGRRAVKHQRKLALLLYPEGTLVSALTRPKSKAYAEKKGVVSFVRLGVRKEAEADLPLRFAARHEEPASPSFDWPPLLSPHAQATCPRSGAVRHHRRLPWHAPSSVSCSSRLSLAR